MLVSRTPFRFSLIGGGSDLPAYFTQYGPSKIISMTLTASMYVTFSPRHMYSDIGAIDSPIRLSYTKTENVNSIEDLQHDLVRAVLQEVHYKWGVKSSLQSFEMTTIADIPSRGSGLGSSSALIVGMLRLFNNLKTLQIPYLDANLAKMAFLIETEKLGKNIGFQDHFSAVFGGLTQYIIGSLCDLSYPIMYHLVGHELAEHLLAFRLPVDRSHDTVKLPDQKTLDDMKADMKNRSNAILFTVELVDNMWEALGQCDFKEVGRILGHAWTFKKLSHGILDENLDRLYNLGIQAGALAGKVSGSLSGGAGHLFFLAYPDVHERIRQALSELVEFKVEYYPYGSTVTEI